MTQQHFNNKNRYRKLFLYCTLPVLKEHSLEKLELYLQNIRDDMDKLNCKIKNEVCLEEKLL